MYLYKRICFRLDSRGFLKKEDELNYDELNKDVCFVSVFNYTEEHRKKFIETRTVSNMCDVKTNLLVFDFDDKNNLQKARNSCILLIERLLKHSIPQECLRICYSGNKGFHVEVVTDHFFSPQELRSIARIAEDLDSFDSSIYNASRLFRLEGSVNASTGLRKTRLSFEELKHLPIEEIQKLATKKYKYEKTEVFKVTEEILKLARESKKLTKEETGRDVFEYKDLKVDYKNNPLNLSPRKLAISQGIFPEGQRHNSLLILATSLKLRGLLKEQVYYILKAASDIQSKKFNCEKFEKKEIWSIVDSIFKDTWNDGFYVDEKFPTELKKFFDSIGVPESISSENDIKFSRVEDLFDKFTKFVDEYEKNTIKIGIEEIDDHMPVTIGMNLGIIGAAGSGKTSLALKILENCSKNNISCLFVSIDMSSLRLFEKIIYKVSGLSREDIYKKFKNKEANEIIEAIKERFKNVYILDKPNCSVDDIKNYHKKIEETHGVKIKLTIVDYLERLSCDVSDDTAASKKVAAQWQDYVNSFDIAGIMFVQPSKIALSGGVSSPIRDYRSIKGSSYIYQSFRAILSIWRPFYSPKTANLDRYMQMAILKNDLGELAEFDFGWDGKRGEIYNLSNHDKKTFKKLLKEKEANRDLEEDIDDNF